MEENNHIEEIKTRLQKVHSKEMYMKALAGTGDTLIVFAVSIIAAVLAVAFVSSDMTFRTVLFDLVAAVTGIYSVFKIFIPVFRGINHIGFKLNAYALRAGEVFPEIKDDLANAIQLLQGKNEGVSPDLINAAFGKVQEKAAGIDFNDMVKTGKEKKKFFTGLAIAVIAVLLIIFVPVLNNSAYKLIHFRTEFQEASLVSFTITPGNKSFTKGEDAEIKIIATGKEINRISFLSKHEEESDFTERFLTADSSGEFTVTEGAVKSSFTYYARYEEFESERFDITVIDRPLVRNLSIEVTPPAYSGLPKINQDNNGNITTLKGSRISIKLDATKTIDSAIVVFRNSDKISMETTGNNASASWGAYNDDFYKIMITDTDSIQNINPIEYSVKLMQDEYPVIDVIEPDSDVKLGADNIVNTLVKIADDYGFSSLKLHYRISQSQFNEISENFTGIEILPRKTGLEADVTYSWDLAPLFLAENDAVAYYFEIFDNDNVSGPKSVKTRTYMIRVPSLNELFAEAEKIQENATTDLEETLKEAEELNREFEQISNEMKRDDEQLTWEEKEKIENAMERFENLSEKVEKMNEQLSDMRKDMEENNLLSQETIDKYKELQKLMDEISGDDLKEAFEKMQNMLDEMNRDQAQNEFDNLKQNETAFQKSIERTINLLKRLQVEQKMEELTKRTEDILNNQEELEKENSESNSPEENSENAEKQKEISEKLDKLREEMENLQKKMSDMDDMPKDNLEKMMEDFDKMENQELSDEAGEKMEQNKPEEARPNQQQIAQNMQQMQQQMQNMQQQMQQMNQMQVYKDLMRAVDNLLSVSKEQERLKELTKNMSPSSPRFNEVAREQSNLQNDLSNIIRELNELSQKTFAVNPEMGKSIGDAQKQMQMAMNSMHDRNGPMAGKNQGDAMKSLNEAANLMSNAMQNMMQPNGQGGGMMSMMQQLQQMSQQQQMLNQMTQQMMQQGQLSQQQMSELQRLSQEQQMIQKSLSDLNKEARASGESKKLTADLEKIVSEMQEVISGMNTQQLNDELLLKQDQILSKLLDAQRSINERDFEKNRESREGKQFARETPPEILFNTEEGRDKLRDALMKAAREGYTKDYEELIRRYFDALRSKKDQG